jgi:translation initiation factor IF-3
MANYRKKPKVIRKEVFQIFNINRDIKADKVRLIDEEGGMIGVMEFTEALALAESKLMDLVEINPKAVPPVVKLIDYNKFKYQIEKTTHKQKAKEEKTIRVSVRVSENDMNVRARQADGFLKDGHRVKLQVQMRGREKAYPEVAKEVLDMFVSKITVGFTMDLDSKQAGDSWFAFLKFKK